MKPRVPIRRFDVFAEYNRLKALKEGQGEGEAKGYGLWVAKVVASGGGRGATGKPHHADETAGDHGQRQEQAQANPEWHVIGGEPQTDDLFDREIIRRMGAEFYDQVFAPAIATAFNEGRRYESIRDTIRKEWKPGE